MLNLKSYNGKELQNFLAMLNQMEAEGITDIRFIREKLFNEVHSRSQNDRLQIIKAKKDYKKKSKNWRQCPSCGKGFLSPVMTGEDLKVWGCPKCRYSELVG